jgi:hypothetical protein
MARGRMRVVNSVSVGGGVVGGSIAGSFGVDSQG